MKRLSILAIVLVVLAVTALAGCSGGTITGSGDLETWTYYITDFNSLDIDSPFNVEVVRSDSYCVKITVDDNLFDHLSVSQQGKVLKISLNSGEYIDTTQKVAITMPRLQYLELVGVPYGIISGFNSTENLTIKVSEKSYLKLVAITAGDINLDASGSSYVSGDIVARNVQCHVSGTSTVLLQGSAINLLADATEASRIKLGALEVESASVTLTDGSNGAVNPQLILNFDLSGASSLGYCSDPTFGTLKKSADSTLMAVGHVH